MTEPYLLVLIGVGASAFFIWLLEDQRHRCRYRMPRLSRDGACVGYYSSRRCILGYGHTGLHLSHAGTFGALPRIREP